MKKILILLVVGVIVYFAASFITTRVKKEVITKEFEESAKDMTVELVVNTVQRDYTSAYMRSGGFEPTLTTLGNIIKEDLMNEKEVTITSTTLTIVTNDDVTCTFTLDGDILKLSDSCGGRYKGNTIEVGKMSIK